MKLKIEGAASALTKGASQFTFFEKVNGQCRNVPAPGLDTTGSYTPGSGETCI